MGTREDLYKVRIYKVRMGRVPRPLGDGNEWKVPPGKDI